MPIEPTGNMTTVLPAAAREIEEFVGAGGWDQPSQVFALVPTRELLAAQPDLAEQLDPESPLTPIAQEALPSEDLGEALASMSWPDQVIGCAISQEILVLPPDVEAELPADADDARRVAAEHPQRQEARLVAAVLREGGETCVLRLRHEGDEAGEIIQDASLAPNLLNALRETFAA